MSKRFADLTQEEFAEVYPELFENSDRHYKIAKLLTENGNLKYGYIGISFVRVNPCLT